MKRPALRFLHYIPVSALVCFTAAWVLSATGVVRRIEWRSLDWRTNFRVPFQRPPDTRISIVLFEDNTEMNLMPWPPDRAVHGDLIKYLTLAQPKVVTWDVILDATREGNGDAEMARAAAIARRAGTHVITGAVTDPQFGNQSTLSDGPTRPLTHVEGDISLLIGDTHALLPFEALRRESLFAFVDTPPGRDGIRRRIPLVVRVGNAVYPTLSLQTVMAYFDVPAESVRVHLGDAVYLLTRERGELRLPIAKDGRLLLNYRYDQDEAGMDFAAMNYLEALVKLNERFVEESGNPALPALKDGIVFIGQTVTGKADAGPTPRSAQSPLVLVHANLVNNVLADDYARETPPWLVWLGGVLLGAAGIVVGRRRPIWSIAAFGILSAVCYIFATFAAWISASLWLPMTWPLLGFAALQFWVIGRRVRDEQRAREQVRQMFGAYLSPELLAKMVDGGRGMPVVSSERKPVTILFSDLRDFTSLTETLRDEALVEQLNEYLSAMVECIHEEGGTLHKFIGDAVMAVWGDLASEGAAQDARRAARTAVNMHATLQKLNTRWIEQGKPPLRMGIGINHGIVLIGNIGSPRRMEFSAIGDAVNLASRLESLNKDLKTDILVGESLAPLLDGRFNLRTCGAIAVKGKKKHVEVFELLGPA